MTTSIPGVGNQLPQPDPRGWLTFDAPLPADLQRAEDATADSDRYRLGVLDGRPFRRPATDAERQLLAHLGHDLPDGLVTHVSHNGAVRRRRWPQLDPEQ